MVLIPVTALAVVLACVATLVRPRWDVAVLTGLLAAIWSRVNGPVEGRVLHVFGPGRGFTEADVLSVVAVAVAVSGLVRCAASAGRSRFLPTPDGTARGGAARVPGSRVTGRPEHRDGTRTAHQGP